MLQRALYFDQNGEGNFDISCSKVLKTLNQFVHMREPFKILIGKPAGKKQLRRPRRSSEEY
jgi:hypothetical protein